MKSDKQFIAEIYQKAERAHQFKKKKSYKPVYAIIAAIIVISVYSTALLNNAKITPLEDPMQDLNKGRSISPYGVQTIENIIITGVVEEINPENDIYMLSINITESSDQAISGLIQCYFDQENLNIKKGDTITVSISESIDGLFINTILKAGE